MHCRLLHCTLHLRIDFLVNPCKIASHVNVSGTDGSGGAGERRRIIRGLQRGRRRSNHAHALAQERNNAARRNHQGRSRRYRADCREMLTDDQLFEARALWSLGWDTLRIAHKIKVDEDAVYNSIQALKSTSRSPAREEALRLLAPHKEGSPVSLVASTLRRELENCPSTRKTENLREGM